MTATRPWTEAALQAWRDERTVQERELGERRDGAVKRATTWWAQLGLGKLPAPEAVQGASDGVRVVLPAHQPGVQVGVVIPERGRAVLLEVNAGEGWRPAGELGTAADLGRVLEDGDQAATAPALDQPATPADLLLTVLEALVDDAVGRHLDGRL